MRMLVVGAGSTGGYFGGRLVQADRDVTFLVRRSRARQILDDGLQIAGPAGAVTLHPETIGTDGIKQIFDVVLVAVKGYSLAAALDDFAPAVGPGTMILPVLNGMGHMDVLATRFGKAAIVGGVCIVASTLDSRGRIIQLAPFHSLSYGELDGTRSARMEALDQFMQGTLFDARLSLTILRDMWEKWILLATLGALNCLMRGSIGEIAGTRHGQELALRLFGEVVAVVDKVGEIPTPGFLERSRIQMTQLDSTQTSSMYRDLVDGNPVEVEEIIGQLLERARHAYIDTPLLLAAYVNLSVYQQRLSTPVKTSV